MVVEQQEWELYLNFLMVFLLILLTLVMLARLDPDHLTHNHGLVQLKIIQLLYIVLELTQIIVGQMEQWQIVFGDCPQESIIIKLQILIMVV